MVKIAPFEAHAVRYDTWFERYPQVYESELLAVQKQLDECRMGIEIGVGTGRFAAPLRIHFGLEPSRAMGKLARRRGLEIVTGLAEALPFRDAQFDCVLMVTVVCFLAKLDTALQEAYRVLQSGGRLVIGLIDKQSALGQQYQQKRQANPYYRWATFYSVDEVVLHLKAVGFTDFRFTQTIYHPLDEIHEQEPVRPGYGAGGFVVIRARK
ncbi:MAG: methyltransferase domain-containing protein [Methanomicrobia archaeon]|nr:methyltransferase domain-containing protein [Methanomicrobia archaeon]